MTAETKFLFETDFGNPEALRKRARAFTEADLEAARAEAYEAARAELQSTEERRIADLLAEASHKLDGLAAQRDETLLSASQTAVEIAATICRKALPTLAQRHALNEIEGHILRTLKDVHGEPRVVVRVSQANVEALRDKVDGLARGFDGEIVLITDEQLSDTDCHVLWADGGSERDVQRTTTAIDAAVAQITDLGNAPDGPVHAAEPDLPAGAESNELSSDINQFYSVTQVKD